MILICDLMMLLTCTVVLAVSYKRLFSSRLNSFVDIVVVVVYMFMCFPIICNYIVGIPEYKSAYWYQVFLPGMYDEGTVALYDLYVTIVMLALHFYSSKREREAEIEFVPLEIVTGRWVLVLCCLSPLCLMVLSGSLSSYAFYADSLARGLDSTFVFLMNSSLLLSLFSFTLLYFSKPKRSKAAPLLLIVYTFIISWISGKRFIVALALTMYLYAFLYTEDDNKKRTRLFRTLPVLLVGLIGFSGFYMAVIKPLTNTINYDLYEMFRVDFGRDDVTKYVLYQTNVLNNHIVDYPGQSVISYLLFFIPRRIWPAKPFQHYQYLSASILGLPIAQLPAGTTPSGFEMFVANFGLIGIPLFALVLVGYIKLFDSRDSLFSLRLIGLVLCLVLLTQSIDVYLIYVVLSVVFLIKHSFDKRRAARTITKQLKATHNGLRTITY